MSLSQTILNGALPLDQPIQSVVEIVGVGLPKHELIHKWTCPGFMDGMILGFLKPPSVAFEGGVRRLLVGFLFESAAAAVLWAG
jgi:hypothetical protein